MIAVLLYSFASKWTSNLLPDGYTLQHWVDSFNDERMRRALWRAGQSVG